MCTYTDSVMDPRDDTNSSELAGADSNWLEKCFETENIFVDYLKSIMVGSFNIDVPVEAILPEYDGTESGFEALDNLYDLLASLCDSNLNRIETTDLSYNEPDKNKKSERRNKRTLKYLPSYGKELQVKQNRARSHSSVDVDEIMRTQELIDVNAADSRRKLRRVSLGMRPKFSNWSKVKGAFKRDKSNSRTDSRNTDYPDAYYSGDESTEKSGQFSSSHENINQSSSSDEEFEFYPAGYPNELGLSYQADDEQIPRKSDGTVIMKSKSAIIQSQNSNIHASTSTHKNPFKWYRSKNTACHSENDPHEAVSTPPSPYKSCRFLFDEDSISKLNDEHSGNSGNEVSAGASNEVLQEVQNKYESLQKRLSREFYDKYHDWRKSQGHDANDADDEKYSANVDELKLSPLLADQSLSPRFKQKFQEWQKMKGLSLSPMRTKIKTENFNPLKKSKSDWHKWRPGCKSESNVIRFLQDKETGESSQDGDSVNIYANLEDQHGPKRQAVKTNQPVVEKKELAWLEKELQKVAREKQRLEKEKEKYAERETRLRNMKRAIKSGRKRKQEVLVPTSTGLFRFQGISSKFTRKLYEWEKAKGITPESSTFALLDLYYGGCDSQRNSMLQNIDTALLSRSRSVGSVEVAGVGASMLLCSSANYQQSSLSLNDMEQLEEAHLNVENGNLLQDGSQQFDKDDDNEFDLISNESLVIPDYSKCSTSHSIPLSSSSVKSLHDQDFDLCSSNYSKQSNESGDLCGNYDSGPRIMFHSIKIQTDPDYELLLHKKEQRDSANADARSIVDQIKNLRARTSIDDEDRINILTNLEHLADQLVDMVHTLNNHKNENSDELAVQIAELAVTLKKKIKRLTRDELQTNYTSNEKLPTSRQNSNETFQFENAFIFDPPEDTYTDTEDNDSPTVHCTFTLPSWRVNKYTTPSSTESESYTAKNKYVDTRQTKTDKQRGKCFKDDNSSGGDENYDGSDETTLYINLKSMKNKNKRRESSDNISTSASESLIYSDPKDFAAMKYSPSSEPAAGNEYQNVLCCSLTLDGQKGNEVKERKFNSRNAVKDFADAEVEQHLAEHDHDNPPIKMDLRSYSPKPVSTKRKCSSCGKIKRVSKSRKNVSNNYCPCGKKESDKVQADKSVVQKSSSSPNVAADPTFPKSASYSNSEDSTSTKVGKIFRSKVYDFNSLKNDDKCSIESDKSSINVIVPTTRKIFTPLRQNEDGAASAVVSYTIDESEAANKDERNNNKNQQSTNSNFMSPPWVSDLRSKSASPAVDRKNTITDKKSSLPQRPRDKKKLPILELHANVDKLPPASPLSPKRVLNKDSPNNNSSIRMMIAHYNKLTSENPDKKSLDSSCWTSTKQKSSPALERRTRFENTSASESTNIRKSKSAVLAVKNQKPETNDENLCYKNLHFGIAKSSSAGALRSSPPNSALRVNKPTEIKRSPPVNARKGDKKPVIKQKSPSAMGQNKPTKKAAVKSKYGDAKISRSSAIKNSATIASFSSPVLERDASFENVLTEAKLRNMKLQEAKNKFFNDYLKTSVTTAEENSRKHRDSQEQMDDTEDNRSTTTEAEPENMNFSSLNKSISTSAIDDRTRSSNPPGTCEKSPSKSKFGFSSIASKFRKVRMRRHKEPEISAVSSLCRASLMMNIDKEGKQREYLNSSKSCPSSPVMARSMSKRNSSSN